MEQFSNEEQAAEQQFFESIKGFVSHSKYEEIFKCLNIVLESKKIHGFICEGSFSVGKSTTIKGYLKQQNVPFFYINSYSTSLSFYLQIYANKDKIILIDDLAGIWKDEKGIAILKALLNNEEIRYINYLSTTDKLTAPSSFVFNGKLVILCNNITKLLDGGVLSRVLYRKLDFTHQEKLDLIREILDYNYRLTPSQISEITSYIKENIDETVTSFGFRTLLKITEIYLKYPNEWKEMSLKELEKDEDMVLIKELVNKNISIKEQVQEFTERSGKGRTTYFAYKKRYNQLIH